MHIQRSYMITADRNHLSACAILGVAVTTCVISVVLHIKTSSEFGISHVLKGMGGMKKHAFIDKTAYTKG